MRYIVIILAFFVFNSCEKNTFHVYSKDKKQCITIINEDANNRYIIDGYTNSVPETNYIKINLKNVDKLVDGFYGCWGYNNDYKWSILLRNEEIIVDNKLDTTKFIIYHNYKHDEHFNPIISGFKKNDKICFNIYFDYGSLQSFHGDAIVE
jgi:hypothetical protein